jgi:hypothetical protein
MIAPARASADPAWTDGACGETFSIGMPDTLQPMRSAIPRFRHGVGRRLSMASSLSFLYPFVQISLAEMSQIESGA